MQDLENPVLGLHTGSQPNDFYSTYPAGDIEFVMLLRPPSLISCEIIDE